LKNSNLTLNVKNTASLKSLILIVVKKIDHFLFR
jgi:hypothetical protein